MYLPPMILVIDNYDSFTFNLVDLVARHTEVQVVKNDVPISSLPAAPKGILISPGPGKPSDSGISADVLRQYAGVVPILGVCLGHQLIGEYFGGTIAHARAPIHGKTSDIHHTGEGIFESIPQPLRVMRYHSLVVSPTNFPHSLHITAQTPEGEIMALQHRSLPIFGVQFHPESILSEYGEVLIHNWLKLKS